MLRVPNHLRRSKKEAYEPKLISIGPYHRGKDHLAAMEEHKFRYLKRLLQQRHKSNIKKYIESLNKLSKRANDSYEKRFLEERWHDDFLETMLIDGCFIVELIRKGVAQNVSTNDPIFRSGMILYSLKRDLLLLKNQLSFFILEKLFEMTLLPNEQNNFKNMIFRFFNILPGLSHERSEEHNLREVSICHLLWLMHDNWLPSPLGVKAYVNKTDQDSPNSSIDFDLISRNETSKDVAKAHIPCVTELDEARIKLKRAGECCGILKKFANEVWGLICRNEASKEDVEEAHIPCATELNEAGIKLKRSGECCGILKKFANGVLGLICRNEASKEDVEEAHIPCATELDEAGIKFKRARECCSIFDIKFTNGVLEIPKLRIEDNTESLLRNLIAYELFWPDDIRHVIDYAVFMDCLINSSKDVELLRRSGIIDNWLGDDEVVANIFNRLLDNVFYYESSFYS